MKPKKHSERYWAVKVNGEIPYYELSNIAPVPALFLTRTKAQNFIDGFGFENAKVVKVEIREL